MKWAHVDKGISFALLHQTMKLLLVSVILCINLAVNADEGCQARDFKSGKVCICDAKYCDEIPDLGLSFGQSAVFTTTHSGQRLHRETVYATDNEPFGTLHMTIESSRKYQKIEGFGATFTDASILNLKSLPDKLADTIIRQYFSPTGLGFSFGRVPIASNEFSTNVYSYNDVEGDYEMQNFHLTKDDVKWKIPIIQQAQNYSEGRLKLLAVPWSAPGWMKTTKSMSGPGELNGKPGDNYHKAYVKYLQRFFEEYEKHGISFWGLSAQNKPTAGADKKGTTQSMLFTPETQRDFIKTDLGPGLKQSNATNHLNLLIMDDNRNHLPKWADVVLKDKMAAEYVNGIAVQYYDDKASDGHLDKTHKNHPDKFILGTEASQGYKPKDTSPDYGSWTRAADYASDILDDMNNWLVGWIERNLMLDAQGGPSWNGLFADAPTIAMANVAQVYKQPMFYAIAHFSRFIQPGAFRIDHKFNVIELEVKSAAFQNPDGSKVVILLNKGLITSHTVVVKDLTDKIDHYKFKLPTRSIATLYINSINF